MGGVATSSLVSLPCKKPRVCLQTLKPQIRKLSSDVKDSGFIGGQVLASQNDRCPDSESCVPEALVKDVCRTMRLKPRWEQTILSDFPYVNFTDARFVRELFKYQNNVLLSLRFFSWLRLNTDYVPDKDISDALFDLLLESKASSGVKYFLEISGSTPELGPLERYVCCLCEGGLVQDAVEVFMRIRESGRCPSIKTWNSVLSGCVKVGRIDIVWTLYRDMMGSDVAADIDANTVECLIQAFSDDGKALEGYELLRQVLEDGVQPRNVTFNKVISRLSKKGRFNRVSELIHTMVAANCRPDIYTYQEVINALCKRKKMSEALRIFDDLKSRGYAPDRYTYTTMIHGFSILGRTSDACNLWSEMINKGMVPNECAYNAYILGFCKTGDFKEARRLCNEMCDRGLGKDQTTYNTMMRWLAWGGRVNEAYNLFKEMPQKGIVHDVLSYNALILGFCKKGRVIETKNLLKELLVNGLQPTSSSYTPLIKNLCTVGEVKEAEELWTEMQKRGIKPRAYIYDCLITGLCDQGFSRKGMYVLFEMLKNKHRPQKTTIERLVQLHLRNNRLNDALRVSKVLLKLGHSLERTICHSLVTRLCKQNSPFVETRLGEILDSN